MSQRSQCSFLEEVLIWDKETCLENLDSALPRIISKLEESAYIDEGIGILKIICQSFVPCVPSEELEDRVFNHVCKLVFGFINGALSKIHLIVKDALKDTPEEIKAVVEYLELLMDTISCIESCIKHVLSETGPVELSHVQSLPFCAVRVLKEVYTHCKNSTDIYGDLLDRVGEPLSFLFKRTHSLQMSLVNLLDKICITGTKLEEHVRVLCSVCTGLYEICGVVTSLDIKLVISLWKAIVKLCSQHINLLRDRFDVCPLINLLCEEIRQGYKYLFELYPEAESESLGDDKAFSKSSKILGFQMKVVVALLRDFTDYLGNCENSVLDLLLFLHRFLPPSICARKLPGKLESDVRVQIVNATAPILGHLIGNRVFRSALTVYNEERSPDDRLPQLLIQLMVLDMLPKCEADVIDYWLSHVNHNNPTSIRGLLQAIFESIQQCEFEMRIPVMLPGVMFAGKPQRQVSLYEHAATHICGFIGACPAKNFTTLEHTLLENALGDNQLSSLLAIDSWCFLVRYGTASICRDQVQPLISAFKQLSTRSRKSADKLKFLIQRLIKYMSPEHQSALVTQFSPLDDPHLWVALTTSCLNADLAASVRQDLITWGLSVLQGKSAKVLELCNVCKLFTDIFENLPMMDCLSPQQQVLLVNSVCNIWAHFQTTPQDRASVWEHLKAKLLHLTKYLLAVMEVGDIFRVLTVVQTSIRDVSTSDIALAASHFLSEFANLRIAPSFQSQVLNKLPQMFYALMTHPDPLVHHRALEAFVQFASHTVHEDVLPDCVQGNKSLIIRIQHFQNKVPYQFSKKEFACVDYLKNQISEAAIKENTAVTNTGDKILETTEDLETGVETQRPVDVMTDVDVEGSDESTIDQPAKRARLSVTSPQETSASLNVEVNSEVTASTPTVETMKSTKYQTFLDALNTLATDIEQECRRSCPPPQWFVEAASEAVTKISDCICPNNSWFDKLS